MSWYKFKDNDVYVNPLTTYPAVKFLIYSGSSFYNDTPTISGAFAAPIRLTSPGNVSLYELNVDRVSASTGRSIGPSGMNIADNGLIYPFVIKNGTRMAMRTTSNAQFAASALGAPIKSVYPLVATISKEYYAAATKRYTASSVVFNDSGPPTVTSGSVTHLHALKNTLNYYTILSPNYQYSSSLFQRDFDNIKLGLVSVPSIFYGDEIKKGTIDLKFYFTGALAGRAQDKYQNGELIETVGPQSGSVVGVALYNEGILILTGAAALNNSTDTYVTGTADNPRWIHFGGETIPYTTGSLSSSYLMTLSGTNTIQTLTMFATCPKAQLNHSNNPSYRTFTTSSQVSTGSRGYLEGPQIPIKNIVSSSYADPTGSFEKTTFISKIGIYDENQNLIAIAKPATPIRKTAERDFTFKIKLDI